MVVVWSGHLSQNGSGIRKRWILRDRDTCEVSCEDNTSRGWLKSRITPARYALGVVFRTAPSQPKYRSHDSELPRVLWRSWSHALRSTFYCVNSMISVQPRIRDDPMFSGIFGSQLPVPTGYIDYFSPTRRRMTSTAAGTRRRCCQCSASVTVISESEESREGLRNFRFNLSPWRSRHLLPRTREQGMLY